MVYQDPVTSLNPSMRVGPQVEEVLLQHLDIGADAARDRSVELFENVGLARRRTGSAGATPTSSAAVSSSASLSRWRWPAIRTC